MSFFTDIENSRVLNKFKSYAESSFPNKDLDIKEIIPTISSMLMNPEEWDKCIFNIENVGKDFIQQLFMLQGRETELNDLERIFTYTYRFILELELNNNPRSLLISEMTSVKEYIERVSVNFSERGKSQIAYGSLAMSANIISHYLNHQNLSDIREVQKKIEQYLKFTKEVDAKIESINQIKAQLEKYENAFNFVGLYDGFSSLAITVSKEKKVTFWALIILGFLIVLPLGYKLFAILLFNKEIVEVNTQNLVILFTSLISFEIILIYYFRILLANYKSMKSQIIQIELRKTLCQFIQSYSEHSKKLKENSSTTLDKFESIIFSSIVESSDKIPSTFDGIEHVTGMIKSFQK